MSTASGMQGFDVSITNPLHHNDLMIWLHYCPPVSYYHFKNIYYNFTATDRKVHSSSEPNILFPCNNDNVHDINNTMHTCKCFTM